MIDEMNLHRILEQWDLDGKILSVKPFGQGHINSTFCITIGSETDPHRYILQKISSTAFKYPDQLMANVVSVTEYLRKKIIQSGGNPDRETITILPTRNGRSFCIDEREEAWRILLFIENTVCLQSAETPELFEASARAFGKFQYLLRDYPADTLFETISRFHDTENRYENLMRAAEEDPLGRASSVKAELEFARMRKEDCGVCLRALREGRLPLRVTHNDTKLNNVLMDADTLEAICVIDLDTVMPGLACNDFGDSIRFGANHCAEDEPDLSKVEFDLELFRVYTRGFLEGANHALTQAEMESLPWGAKLMTLECGMRFLTDYLEGDHYFATQREGQNLDRCRTQFKLVSDMEANWEAMKEIVASF